MKKILFSGILLAVSSMSFGQYFYTTDGTFSSNRIATLNGKNVTFKPNTGSFFINGTTGFVGVNTITPTTAFDVIGNIQGTAGIFTNSPATQTFTSTNDQILKSSVISAGTLLNATSKERVFNFFDFPQSNYNPTATVWLDIEDRGYKTRFNFWARQSGDSQFNLFDKNQSAYFKVMDDGNGNITTIMPKTNSFFGIGTTSFTDGTDVYKLSVAGNIRAHRVKVYTTWADYVFEEDYKLPTLEEVEKYIDEECHLMDIPSAAEVEENGIELGEMNKLLLQKVEELTLYTIELNKQVQELKKQLNKEQQ